ncbi:2,3-dimethylmalate lyase [Rathayibacter tanaceti]|uniref:2,3-dimethylmalate lyase n=1 Tax=Rathayibacter tanaceti TaxID=1671680 RepID=A0A166INN5_9MICO|nr:2,3-dimethylmalate lyase [Rathayibacter tanaceti]
MLHSTRTPAEKRRLFRERLASQELLQLPGAFTPLSARLIEAKGFDGVYVSGAVLSAELGLPDIGLTTLTEVAARSQQIARMTDLPVLVDADTGFGEPLNVARTVQTLEDAGVAGLHIEDQVNPKRCGHLDGKAVVDEATSVRRIAAAVDARRDPDLVIMPAPTSARWTACRPRSSGPSASSTPVPMRSSPRRCAISPSSRQSAPRSTCRSWPT